MESNKKIENGKPDLFVRYSEEITPAFERAVRNALRKHKQAGNPIAVEKDGELVILQPDEINVA